MEQILLKDISKHKEGKEVIKERQHGLTKCKSCLTILLALYNRVTECISGQRKSYEYHLTGLLQGL